MPTTTCPECGAVYHDETTCQSIFDSFLVLEFQYAGYGEVHMLTVACFMVQHGRYSDAGLRWIAERLREYLEEGKPTQAIRAGAVNETGQDVRDWKVIRQPGDRPLPKIAWSMTIGDVSARFEDPAVFYDSTPEENAARYQELIREWGRVTLREMQPWVAVNE